MLDPWSEKPVFTYARAGEPVKEGQWVSFFDGELAPEGSPLFNKGHRCGIAMESGHGGKAIKIQIYGPYSKEEDPS